MSTASPTVRVIGPAWDRVSTTLAGCWGTLPQDGLKPKAPQKAAGMRIEPAPSVPWARAPRPAATAAAAPPLEPPGVRPWRQGLWVGPQTRLPESPFHPSSGVFVLPRRTMPASRRRSVRGASKSGTQSAVSSEPRVVRMPRVAVRSFRDPGMPASGGI